MHTTRRQSTTCARTRPELCAETERGRARRKLRALYYVKFACGDVATYINISSVIIATRNQSGRRKRTNVGRRDGAHANIWCQKPVLVGGIQTVRRAKVFKKNRFSRFNFTRLTINNSIGLQKVECVRIMTTVFYVCIADSIHFFARENIKNISRLCIVKFLNLKLITYYVIVIYNAYKIFIHIYLCNIYIYNTARLYFTVKISYITISYIFYIIKRI